MWSTKINWTKVRLSKEVLKHRGNIEYLQVFSTTGLKCNHHTFSIVTEVY